MPEIADLSDKDRLAEKPRRTWFVYLNVAVILIVIIAIIAMSQKRSSELAASAAGRAVNRCQNIGARFIGTNLERIKKAGNLLVVLRTSLL